MHGIELETNDCGTIFYQFEIESPRPLTLCINLVQQYIAHQRKILAAIVEKPTFRRNKRSQWSIYQWKSHLLHKKYHFNPTSLSLNRLLQWNRIFFLSWKDLSASFSSAKLLVSFNLLLAHTSCSHVDSFCLFLLD